MALQVPTRLVLKQILLPTDLSPASDAALAFAVAIARRFDATVHVLHVLTHSELQPTPEAAPIPLGEDVTETAKDRVAEFLRSPSFEGVRHDARIRSGSGIWSEIAAVIESDNTDLVVLGTHGREGVSQVVLGSVAETVFRAAPCPVLVIGPKVVTRKPAPKFRDLLFATDLSPQSLKSLPFVLAFVEDNEANLIVAHVSTEKVHSREEQVLAEESQLKWMRELIPPRSGIEHQVRFGSPAERILELAAERNCDLILLGAHHASSFATHVPGAVAHRIVSEARCPVLTIHVKETTPDWY